MPLRIGEVAKRAGTTTAAIRYYESIGLLRAPERSAAGYRRYADRAIEEIQFIRKAQVVGFSLDEVREILVLARSGRQPCDRVKAIVQAHLRVIEQQLEELENFRNELAAHLDRWTREGSAAGGAAVCGWIQGINDSTLPNAARLPRPRRANGATGARKTKKEKH